MKDAAVAGGGGGSKVRGAAERRHAMCTVVCTVCTVVCTVCTVVQ